jgi:pilus assembly protein Flp/PilA
MTNMYLRLLESLRREEGQGMVEYALILVLVSVVAIAVLSIVGTQVTTVFQDIVTSLGG